MVYRSFKGDRDMRQLNFFIVLVMFSAFAQAADIAAYTGGTTGGMNFSCNDDTLKCECKGAWNGGDCKLMRKMCPNAEPNCQTGLGTCYCTVEVSSRVVPMPVALPGAQLVAPLKKKTTSSSNFRPKIKIMSPARLNPKQATIAPKVIPAQRKMMKPLKSSFKIKTGGIAPIVERKSTSSRARILQTNKIGGLNTKNTGPAAVAISSHDCTTHGGTVHKSADCPSKQQCILNKINSCVTKATAE